MPSWMTTTLLHEFDELYDSTPSRVLTLDGALDAIRQGHHRRAITHVRAVLASAGTEAYTAAKSRLRQWTFAGTFSPTRRKDRLLQHSGLCHADIDHLADLAGTKVRLCQDPAVVYCFVSPGGDGLKYGVRIPVVTTDEAYKHAWGVLAAAHLDAYGVTWDPSGKDICRLCYVAWDPDCWVHADAVEAPIPPPMVIPPAPRTRFPVTIPLERRERYAQRALAQAVRLIEASTEGSRHAARCKAAYLLGGYVGGGVLTAEEAYAVLREAVEGHTTQRGPALRTIVACLAAGADKPIALADLEADWQAWCARQRHGRVVRSLQQPSAPLRRAALHLRGQA